MTRPIRRYSNSKTYHIIFRGINKQNIFFDYQDMKVFLKKLLEIKKEFYFKIFAYCIMTNHVHLVIKVEKEFLSKGMQSLLIRYSRYFNKKYERIGTFVQDRFKSKNIENQKYFLDVCRYVHRNPENARICKTEDYQWSSYKEYTEGSKIIDKEELMNYFNNDIRQFIKFTTKSNPYDINEFAEFEIVNKLEDYKVLEIIMEKFELRESDKVISFFKEKDNEGLKECIEKIKDIKGITLSQISRITQISKWRIKKFWN